MAEQIEKAERDFLTFDVKFNGLEELREMMKEAKQFVQTLKEAQELIEYLSRKCGYDVKDIAGRLVYDLENASREIRDEIQKIEGKKEESDLPHEILKLIFSKYPDGVSVGEIRYILKETQSISEDIQMVF